MLDDLLALQERLATMPPQPIRVRVTPALWDRLAHLTPLEVHRIPPIPTLALGLPVVVDADLPDRPGFELDYPAKGSPPNDPNDTEKGSP